MAMLKQYNIKKFFLRKTLITTKVETLLYIKEAFNEITLKCIDIVITTS